METLRSLKAIGQIAKAYGIHPNTIHKRKKDFIEEGPEPPMWLRDRDFCDGGIGDPADRNISGGYANIQGGLVESAGEYSV
jgi:hypothetical protein